MKFDPGATMFINTQIVRDFVKVLPAPMGFGKETADVIPEEDMNAFMGETLELPRVSHVDGAGECSCCIASVPQLNSFLPDACRGVEWCDRLWFDVLICYL